MRRVGGAAAAAAVLIMLTGCGSQAAEPTASPTLTVVQTPSAAPTSTPAPTATATATASATATAAATPAPSTTRVQADPGRPAGQCADSDLGVAVTVVNGGGGAGSEAYDVLITNTGGSSCVLRGAPGVSVVGKGDGTQLGEPADRVQAAVTTVRLAAGQTAAAPLTVVNVRGGGGPLGAACRVEKGDGYRVYPPHSKKAFFVESADAYACTSSSVFMRVGPVVRFTD